MGYYQDKKEKIVRIRREELQSTKGNSKSRRGSTAGCPREKDRMATAGEFRRQQQGAREKGWSGNSRRTGETIVGCLGQSYRVATA